MTKDIDNLVAQGLAEHDNAQLILGLVEQLDVMRRMNTALADFVSDVAGTKGISKVLSKRAIALLQINYSKK